MKLLAPHLTAAAGVATVIFAASACFAADGNIDGQVKELLSKMTAEEKVLQLLSYCPNGVPRLGIPSLQAGEALHGVVTGAGAATSFPQAIALAATWDPEAVEQMGVVIGKEARAVGLHQVFAPMLGLARDPRWGRVEESYGEDTFLAAEMGVAYINGVQGKGAERFGPDKVIATPKHFIADGEPWGGHNGESFDTSERVLREVYLPVFEAAVKRAHTGSMMPAHHQLNGVPCHANPWLLDTVARQEWGFDGFYTSDMGDIPKLADGHHYARNGERDPFVLAFQSGVDTELVGSGYKSLVEALKQGKVSQDLIDLSAGRVLKAKLQLIGLGKPGAPEARAETQKSQTSDTILSYKGTDDIWARLIADGKFDTPEGSRRPNAKEILADPAHDALSLKLAQESVVLLKNEDALLPLDKARLKKILVVGPLAGMVNLGGYSGGGSHPAVTIIDGIKAAAGAAANVVYQKGCSTDDTDESLLPKAVAEASDSDVIIAVVGHSRRQVGENLDRDNLDLVGGQEKLVEAMHASGKPVVVVLENGAPLTINWIAEKIPAIVEAWYGGQNAGTAVAQVLFGEVNPGGKLPVSFPKNLGQIPCYYSFLPITGPSDYYQSKWKNPFVFGEGLSYTTFEFSGLKVEPREIEPGQQAVVSVTVKNIGGREGDEVPQLYLHQPFTSVERPVKELKGFQRVTLKPGESRTVSFPVGFEQVKFWKDGKWVSEPGVVEIGVGSSSRDIRVKGELKLGGA